MRPKMIKLHVISETSLYLMKTCLYKIFCIVAIHVCIHLTLLLWMLSSLFLLLCLFVNLKLYAEMIGCLNKGTGSC